MAPEIQNRERPESGGKPGVSTSDALPDLPSRGYFLLKEVCGLTDTQPYVLRFWESEFPQLAGSGDTPDTQEGQEGGGQGQGCPAAQRWGQGW